MIKCEECGNEEEELFEHDSGMDIIINICSDCMRRIHHCLVCDKYIPDMVDNYFEYESDLCPECE